MRELTQEEIQILQRHAKWLADEEGGKRADLCAANLYGANLRNADLRDADLYGANLCAANLCGANLRGANLYDANLYGANLYGANLYDANLRGANLRGANLRNADLRGAKNILAVGPIGSRLDITYAVKHRDRIMIKCGCFWENLEQWQAQCRAIHGDNSHAAAYAAAANFIKAYAAAYWQD
nr:MAG TPA: pentapeptide repeat protein [Caudoviricetes sp.]